MTKKQVINNWKKKLPNPDDDDAWYNSLVGLAYRLYRFNLITLEELKAEGVYL